MMDVDCAEEVCITDDVDVSVVDIVVTNSSDVVANSNLNGSDVVNESEPSSNRSFFASYTIQ